MVYQVRVLPRIAAGSCSTGLDPRITGQPAGHCHHHVRLVVVPVLFFLHCTITCTKNMA